MKPGQKWPIIPFSGVGVIGWHWHPHTKIKQIFQKLKNTIASFKILLYYNE
jgi:hypothetical protein